MSSKLLELMSIRIRTIEVLLSIILRIQSQWVNSVGSDEGAHIYHIENSKPMGKKSRLRQRGPCISY